MVNRFLKSNGKLIVSNGMASVFSSRFDLFPLELGTVTDCDAASNESSGFVFVQEPHVSCWLLM